MHPLDPLVTIVERLLQFEPGDLSRRSQSPRLVMGRGLFVYVALEDTDCSVSEIAEAIGRSRTTIAHIRDNFRPEVRHSAKLKALAGMISRDLLTNSGCLAILKEKYFLEPPDETDERSAA